MRFAADATYSGQKIKFVLGAQRGYFTRFYKRLKCQFLEASSALKARLDELNDPQWRICKSVVGVFERHRIHTHSDRVYLALSPCYQKDCPHPICADPSIHEAAKAQTWGPGLPKLSDPFFPVLDESYKWGTPGCERCNATCRGNFMKPGRAFAAIRNDPSCQMKKPPSLRITDNVAEAKAAGRTELTCQEIEQLARRCLMTTDEVTWYARHKLRVRANPAISRIYGSVA